MSPPRSPRLLAQISFFVIWAWSPGLCLAGDSQLLALPTWDRQYALEVASTVDVAAESERLINLVREGDQVAMLTALDGFAARDDRQQPCREAVLYAFVNKLRELEPFAVNAGILNFLTDYPTRVSVPHEESFTTAVPLFPVRAAASGLVNQWTRQMAAAEAGSVLLDNPVDLLNSYLANPDPNIRAGIESALDRTQAASLVVLLEAGLPLLREFPELTGLLGKAALLAHHTQSLEEIFTYGGGSGLTVLGRLTGQALTAEESGKLLLRVIESAPASTAAMAIAQWSPRSIRLENVGGKLMSLLGDPELGSAAALALASWGSKQQQGALMLAAEQASAGSLAGKRAQTALSIAADRSGKPAQ